MSSKSKGGEGENVLDDILDDCHGGDDFSAEMSEDTDAPSRNNQRGTKRQSSSFSKTMESRTKVMKTSGSTKSNGDSHEQEESEDEEDEEEGDEEEEDEEEEEEEDEEEEGDEEEEEEEDEEGEEEEEEEEEDDEEEEEEEEEEDASAAKEEKIELSLHADEDKMQSGSSDKTKRKSQRGISPIEWDRRSEGTKSKAKEDNLEDGGDGDSRGRGDREEDRRMLQAEDEDLLLLMAIDEGDDDLALLLLCQEDFEQDTWSSIHFDLDSLSDSQCRTMFRFEKPDIRRLAKVLSVPDPVILPNQAQLPAVEALCLLLRRFAYPCRLADLRPIFRRSRTTIGKAFTFMVNYIYDKHSVLLSSLEQRWLQPQNLQIFANKVMEKGAPLDNCWGFIDGTARSVSRPTYDQKEMFSGHKRMHVLKFQSVMAPNGLIATLNGPFSGKRHDSGILTESGLLDILEQRMNDAHGNPFCLYGDPAYPLRLHLMCPFKGTTLTREQENFNKRMASVRDCVEWGLGKIISLFAFLDYKKNLKICLQPVGKFYIVAGLLTNAHTCLYGSQTGDYFNLQPPSLEEYFRK